MEAPLHQVCGTRHWSKEPCPGVAASKVAKRRIATIAHVADPTSLTAAISKVIKDTGGKVLMGAEVVSPPVPKKGRGRPKSDGPSAGKSKRAEYQRELMRKRAAKPK